MLSELQPNDLSRHSHLCRPCQFHQCTLSSISVPMESLLQLVFFFFQLSDNLTLPNSRIVLSKTSHPPHFYAPASTGKGRREFFGSVLDTWILSCPLFYSAEESFLSARSQQRPYSLCQDHRDSTSRGLSRCFFMVPSELYLTVHPGVSLENWALSETFRAHYQCNPMTTVHFTTPVLDHAVDAMVVFCDADKKTYSGWVNISLPVLSWSLQQFFWAFSPL